MPREPDRAPFEPALPEAVASAWAEIAATLLELDGEPARIEALAGALPGLVAAAQVEARPRLRAAGLVALDLARQGWWFSGLGGLCVAPPDREREALAERGRVRAQLHLERDRQLREPAVREFIGRMETRRPFAGRWVSVFDLMRDGRELAGRLRAAIGLAGEARASALASAIQPYLQVVEAEARCRHTGLLLGEIWRYFRHTWATPYKSVPGRGLMFLVRDAAAEHHPVMGIALLSSAPAQIACRDAWIGWQPDALVRRMREAPTDAYARWLVAELRRGLAGIYVQDLLEDGLITPAELRDPSPETLGRLREEARRARAEHARFARSRDHKREHDELPPDPEGWVRQARLPLFRGKRAALLADLLDVRRVIGATLGEPPGAEALGRLLASAEGRRAVRLVARRAKADRMGVAIAEIGVCGAISPYSELLGGKLVALLMASPEVQALYAARYGAAPSLIASSMAGRHVSRGGRLCLLTTSSLFHVASAQYNRLSVPVEALGGEPGRQLRYEDLGLTVGFGSSQFSVETARALEALCEQHHGGRRVNRILGEGSNPTLRMLREGLDVLGLPSDMLLQHGSPRRVYGVSLVSNLEEALLGVAEPTALLSEAEPAAGTSALVRWWRARWLDRRSSSAEVLARLESHRLERPIRHGARVRAASTADDSHGEHDQREPRELSYEFGPKRTGEARVDAARVG